MHRLNFNSNSYSRLSSRVQEAITNAIDIYGDARPISFGSDHKISAAIEESRYSIAEKLHLNVAELFFNNGCKSAEIELIGVVLNLLDIEHIITSCFESPDKLEFFEFIEKAGKIKLHFIETNEYGEIYPEQLKEILINKKNTALLSLSHANFFSGVLLPVKAILQICKTSHIYFHLNAQLTLGRFEIDFETIKSDFVTFDASLINGPGNVGCTIYNNLIGLDNKRYNYLKKAIQFVENKNISNILGLNQAISKAMDDINTRQDSTRLMRNQLIKQLGSDLGIDSIDSKLNKPVLYNHVAFWAKHAYFGKYIIEKLDLEGVDVSQIPFPVNMDSHPNETYINIGIAATCSSSDIDFFVEILQRIKAGRT